MKRLIGVGLAATGAAIAVRYAARPSRARAGDAAAPRWVKKMERVLASLPENAPPRLVMSVLPRLQAQNEEILALLREQNALLRAQSSTTASKTAA